MPTIGPIVIQNSQGAFLWCRIHLDDAGDIQSMTFAENNYTHVFPADDEFTQHLTDNFPSQLCVIDPTNRYATKTYAFAIENKKLYRFSNGKLGETGQSALIGERYNAASNHWESQSARLRNIPSDNRYSLLRTNNNPLLMTFDDLKITTPSAYIVFDNDVFYAFKTNLEDKPALYLKLNTSNDTVSHTLNATYNEPRLLKPDELKTLKLNLRHSSIIEDEQSIRTQNLDSDKSILLAQYNTQFDILVSFETAKAPSNHRSLTIIQRLILMNSQFRHDWLNLKVMAPTRTSYTNALIAVLTNLHTADWIDDYSAKIEQEENIRHLRDRFSASNISHELEHFYDDDSRREEDRPRLGDIHAFMMELITQELAIYNVVMTPNQIALLKNNRLSLLQRDFLVGSYTQESSDDLKEMFDMRIVIDCEYAQDTLTLTDTALDEIIEHIFLGELGYSPETILDKLQFIEELLDDSLYNKPPFQPYINTCIKNALIQELQLTANELHQQLKEKRNVLKLAVIKQELKQLELSGWSDNHKIYLLLLDIFKLSDDTQIHMLLGIIPNEQFKLNEWFNTYKFSQQQHKILIEHRMQRIKTSHDYTQAQLSIQSELTPWLTEAGDLGALILEQLNRLHAANNSMSLASQWGSHEKLEACVLAVYKQFSVIPQEEDPTAYLFSSLFDKENGDMYKAFSSHRMSFFTTDNTPTRAILSMSMAYAKQKLEPLSDTDAGRALLAQIDRLEKISHQYWPWSYNSHKKLQAILDALIHLSTKEPTLDRETLLNAIYTEGELNAALNFHRFFNATTPTHTLQTIQHQIEIEIDQSSQSPI